MHEPDSVRPWKAMGLISCLLVVGCGLGDTPPAGASAGADEVVRQELHPASPLRSPAALAAARADAQGHTGAVFTTMPPAPGTELRIAFHLEPDENSPLVALYRPDQEGGLRAREKGLESILSRVGHEEYGFLAHQESGDWVQVTYGFTAEGEVRRGWTLPSPPEVQFVTLVDALLYCGGYLMDPGTAEFFVEPGGPPADVPAGRPLRAEPGEDHLADRLDVLSWTELAMPDEGPPAIWLEVQPSGSPGSESWWLPLWTGEGELQLMYEAGHCSPSLAIGR